MADEQAVGLLQFVTIVAVSVIFGGILVVVVLSVGGKKNTQDDGQVPGDGEKNEEKKNGEKPGETQKPSKVAAKSSKRSTSTKEHPKQLCILKGHTSDILHIEFSSNGKILGSTSTGIETSMQNA